MVKITCWGNEQYRDRNGIENVVFHSRFEKVKRFVCLKALGWSHLHENKTKPLACKHPVHSNKIFYQVIFPTETSFSLLQT